MRIITLIVSLFLFCSLHAQDSVSVKSSPGMRVVKNDSSLGNHSPRRAAIYSAILPGAGQVYNRQTWKVAVIYGGIGALGYFAYDNNRIYKDYLEQWKFLTDSNPNTNVRSNLQGVSADALHNAFSSFRKFRDQCTIGLVLVYAANIIDANVYGHLYYFNVDDLSLRFTPNYNFYAQTVTPAFTLSYKF